MTREKTLTRRMERNIENNKRFNEGKVRKL